MTHATNEQMALVMGWHKQSVWWFTESDAYAGFTNDHAGKGSRQFRPTHDLNHAALVEARLRELGLVLVYVEAIQTLLKEQHGKSFDWALLTATARTRCDAAWAAYQAWKEQAT